MKSLQRGIYYDPHRSSPKRFRVRRYKDGKARLAGYYLTYEEAVAALSELSDALVIEAPPKKEIDAPRARFADLARAAQLSRRR